MAFDFLSLLEDNLLDYTKSFRALLALVAADKYPFEQQLLTTLNSELTGDAKQSWQQWCERYLAQVEELDKAIVLQSLQSNNPIYVLRNDMAQRAIDAAEQGQFGEVTRLYDLLAKPFEVQDIALISDTTPPAPNAPQQPISCSS